MRATLFPIINISAVVSALKSKTICCWEMDESSGANMTDSHTNGLDGTISGATIYQTGKLDKAYSYNGTSSFVTVADNDLLSPASGFSISSWFNFTSLATWPAICGKQGEYTLYVYSDGTVRFNVYDVDGSSYIRSQSSVAVTAGVWHHLVATWNGGLDRTTCFSLYLDGVNVTGDPGGNVGILPAGLANTGNALFLGKTSSGNFASGLIDQTAILGVALNAGEVAGINNSNNGKLFINW